MNPVLLAAMSDVDPEEAGLSSGVVNTAFMIGGALGLAVLASIAALAHVTHARRSTTPRRLNGGYQRRSWSGRSSPRPPRPRRNVLPRPTTPVPGHGAEEDEQVVKAPEEQPALA